MSNIQSLTNAQVRAYNLRPQNATVTDFTSGERYNIFWGGSPFTHTDFSPLTRADTDIMKRISNGWSWTPRPVILHIGGIHIAASVHHFPHGSVMGGNPGLPNNSNSLSNQTNRPHPADPRSEWGLGGHMCIYFRDSVSNGNGLSDHARQMQATAARAFTMAQNAGFAHTSPANPIPSVPSSVVSTTVSPASQSGSSQAEGNRALNYNLAPQGRGHWWQVHTVVAGDTLGHLALRYLGAAHHWSELHDLNRDIIGDDPDRLRVGQVLRIPN